MLTKCRLLLTQKLTFSLSSLTAQFSHCSFSCPKMLKRPLHDSETALVKRSRPDEESSALVLSEPMSSALSLLPNPDAKTSRRSQLQEMNLVLTGHESAVLSICFDSTGKNIASGSMDHTIMLWEVYGNCNNYNVLSGHKNAVLETKWISSSPLIVSASADKTAALWDANKGIRIRKYTDHTGIVNTVSVAQSLTTIFASGSDDCTAVIWDIRHKRAVQSLYHDYQVTCTAISHDGQYLYTGGLDNIIRRYDLRKGDSSPDLQMQGHTDTLTGLAISPDGNFLLSNSMDCTLKSWDLRPFVNDPSNRVVSEYTGCQHGAEKNLLRCSWSPDQNFISCGSADRVVHIFDSLSANPVYLLPGHKGCVNEVAFHPNEPIIASCSSDKQIILGELGSV